jgi:hypothetical protein
LNLEEDHIPAKLNLISLQGTFSICQLDPGNGIPDWAQIGDLFSISHTIDELSIICEDRYIPEHIKRQKNWRVIKIEGDFDFDEIGILNSITMPLARARISLLTFSTFNTDYILIQDSLFPEAVNTLKSVGHQVI